MRGRSSSDQVGGVASVIATTASPAAVVSVTSTGRLLLPVRRIGFLAVRSRPVDVTLTTAVGLAVVAITLATPPT